MKESKMTGLRFLAFFEMNPGCRPDSSVRSCRPESSGHHKEEEEMRF